MENPSEFLSRYAVRHNLYKFVKIVLPKQVPAVKNSVIVPKEELFASFSSG
jgi:hypothetical protein